MKKSSQTIKHFYQILDDDVKKSLNQNQRINIERAILSMTASQRHTFDMRQSFKFFKNRYYLVFLMGKDHRRHLRNYRSLSMLFFSVTFFFILIGISSFSISIFDTLKSLF